MKSNLVYGLLLSAFFVFASCKKEEEAEVTSNETPKEIIAPNVDAMTNQNFGQQPVPQNTVPPNQMGTVQTVTPAQAPAVTRAGMNPAHGQPGHRCDIAVGAPLNSPPGNSAKAGNAIVQQNTPVASTTQNQAAPAILTSNAPAATAPGMNPPHGQEGHVCSVAVGAPLPKTSDSQQ